MQATDILEDEHQQILKIINLLEKAADKLDKGGYVSPQFFDKAGFFIREYADRIHHFKEEDFLFAIMQHARVPENVSISIMLTEHDQGRVYLRKLLQANFSYKKGSPEARDEVVKHVREYTNLLKEHIRKEDEELFLIANRVISEEKKKELVEIFKKKTKQQKPERYLKMIDELEEMVK